jgi:radical SAM superfamily enzyme YgiQ (UPF0313 family)
MTKLSVLLMQLPVPNNPSTNVPLAAGYLKAYAHAQGLLDRVTIDILPRALADSAGDALLVEIIAAHRPDVLGISLYTWNSERSLDIARRVKARLPDLLVIVGGPEAQRDNDWILRHPAVDVVVIGEGEQTFAELLSLSAKKQEPRDKRQEITRGNSLSDLRSLVSGLAHVPGLAFRDEFGNLILTPERAPLGDLSALPSPYLLGYLEPTELLMVEISRWCPYACSFCLYGRNMGPKLGNRYFPLERVLAEIGWGRERGARSVHFVEANLNLVPIFWPLMRALADSNADSRLALYAELRGEHLTEEAVAALHAAGLCVAEVGLQTANPAALRAARRKTDLGKWAAGTRRLLRHGVETYLDVILGLPADDSDGVAATLDFIERESLGAYDVFTLQVLPGTGARAEAQAYSLVYQDRPPYYVLATDRLDYAELRRLRRELKRGADLDPDEIEGCPLPRAGALRQPTNDQRPTTNDDEEARTENLNLELRTPNAGLDTWHPALDARHAPIDRLWLPGTDTADWRAAGSSIGRLASHVDVIARWDDAARLAELLARAIAENPATLFDCYLQADTPPKPAELRAWRDALPFQPGYLDRVAVYRRAAPAPAHARVSPRLWLVLPWAAQADPADYADVAELIWEVELAADEAPPLGAWRVAGGAGVLVRGHIVTAEEQTSWSKAIGGYIWSAASEH